jgi:glutathione S-transferase
MKLYYSPGACSIGIHILLEEIGKPYDVAAVNFAEGAQYKAPFIDVSAKSKVPVLVRDDGSVLTEFPAIAYWLAASNPDAGLLPDDIEARTRALEIIDYTVATVHMQGFFRMFRPAAVSPDEAGIEAVKARGREIVTKGLGLLDSQIGAHDYAVSDRLSIADAALFYVSFWEKIRLKRALPARLDTLFARLWERPAVQRVLQAEGFA